MVFNPNDRIAIEVRADQYLKPSRGLVVSVSNEVRGGAFNFSLAGESHMASSKTYHFRNYQFISRFGGRTDSSQNTLVNQGFNSFNTRLVSRGFPGENPIIPLDTETNALRGSDIIAATDNGEARSFLVFSMLAGAEAHSSQVGGYAAGRKTATRPFLHGSSIAAPLVDSFEKNSLYNVGWEWQVDRINEIEEAVQMDPGSGNTYYGGGYTAEAGTTRVVQQHLPVVPPISIAALCSAHLGGFSLANQPVIGGADEEMLFDEVLRGTADPDAFKKVTSTGAAGLAPHVMQAIGNSYAHPNIPANQASATKIQVMDIDHPPREVPFVDHSYLANKALWDEYFFSSITPQPSNVRIYEESRTLEQVAEQFFFGGKSLPNRRMIPYTARLDESKLTQLLAEKDGHPDGMADKIAAHLMVEGGFNVNSTSVEAWKVLLSSLKGKPVSYLNEGVLSEQSVNGVPAGSGVPGNAPLVTTEDITSSNNPPEQWTTGRVLGDQEIEELAEAIVRQVRERGPFLSMSDFINRRLEGDADSEMSARSVKGALQAALDDPAVSINANFRRPERMLDNETTPAADGTGIVFPFPDAAKGPIAYGSTAYVDQADLLCHFAEQLTPRGDTFVIRTYGDSLDATGNVEARAWCEAVVQRLPEYVDGSEEAHKKQADLNSAANITFGRKFVITSFRWLNPDEI